jgi:SAM-dependent methyltransferase
VGYVFKLTDAERHENWFQSRRGQLSLALEKDILGKIWSPISPQRVLEVGCGTGVFLEWFASQGHLVTGLEPASSSLELARRRMGGKVQLDQGFAENLPYEDNEFDTVAIITTLEFVEDPYLALKEAFRVARGNVLLGVLNKYSLKRLHLFFESFWQESLYDRAKFFSVFQLERMTGKILSGSVPIEWRTCISLPLSCLQYTRFLERCPALQRVPFGHFIAMRIDMRSRLHTVQTPVFSKIPTGAANASVRSMSPGSAAAHLGSRSMPCAHLDPQV